MPEPSAQDGFELDDLAFDDHDLGLDEVALAPSAQRAEGANHVTILAYLSFAQAALIAGGLVFFSVLLSDTGLLSTRSEFWLLFRNMALVLLGFGALSGITHAAAGWGLLRRARWARVLALVLGAISLFSVPVGTALGIYALWALSRPDSRAQFV